MTISQEQLHTRWERLPEELQDEIASDANDELLDSLTQPLSIPLAQHKKVAYICLLVFSGFLRIKDVYEELCSSAGLDARSALRIYQGLDQGMFSRSRAAIEANFRHFQEAAASPAQDADFDIAEGASLEEKIVIKGSSSPDVVDLKALQKQAPAPQDHKAAALAVPQQPVPAPHPILQGEAPLIINFSSLGQPAPAAPNPSIIHDAPMAFQPAPASFQQASAAQVPPAQPASPRQAPPAPAAPFQQPAPAAQPFMLHQQAAAAPIAQGSQAAYKSVSFGSFMGSFKGGFSKPAQPASRASIEMPSAPLQDLPPRPHVLRQKQDPAPARSIPAADHPEQEVSFSVKKYAEAPKVVNYGDPTTPLDA